MTASPLIQTNVPLAPLTTLGIGGPARWFVAAHDETAVLDALAFAAARGLPVFVLGGGSNVVIADAGFPGLVLRVAVAGLTWRNEGEAVLVTAGAGVDWDELAAQCVARALAGVECLSGIPGSVGGTPVQNVGAYGQEVSETIVAVRAFDRRTQRIIELSRAGCGFGYRTSIFNTTERERYLVLGVTYALQPHGAPALHYQDVRNHFAAAAAPPSLREVREAVRTIRARKAMLLTPDDPDSRSAGSFFKNPLITPATLAQIAAAAGVERVPSFPVEAERVKVPAAWLIEHAGFHKGYRPSADSRVAISAKHTLALVNCGGATARELLAFADEIAARVGERFGVALALEPVLVGFEDRTENC